MKLILGSLCFVFICNLNAQNLKDKADDLYANGNYTKAIAAYKLVKNANDVYDDIAKAYIAIGNYGEGLDNYKKAVESNKDNAFLQYEYAKLLTKTKKFNEANQRFRALIRLDSLNPNYHYELGVVLQKQNDSTAINEFQKTFDLDQTHQKAIFKIARRYIVKRKFELAHQLIDKGLKSYTNNKDLINLKAQAFYYEEYYTKAIVWFKKLLDLGEKSEFIYEKLSLSYAKNSDYEDAIYYRKQALKYSPNDANAMYVIGSYYERLNNFKKAETYISKSLKLQDVSLSNEYHKLGMVLNRQKKYGEAIKAFQKSLSEDPSNIMSEFAILRTKDEFYADIDAKIKLYEQFIATHQKGPFLRYAKERLIALKQQKFLD